MRFDKLLTYFITIVFILSNSIGVIIVYNQIKFYHKRTIKEQIKQNNFQEVTETLSFSKSDLKNKLVNLEFIEEYEFRYNGKLYDIITQWETDDSIYYKCINDTKEEELEAIFVNYVVNNTNREDLPLLIKQLLNSLHADYYLVNKSNDLPTFTPSVIAFNRLENLLDVCLVTPEPPPRIFH